ncbi:hypothetical protein LTS18_007246 [Coniosporium uncinatum]|uniref:Uncharacterized protein n=1 Tax=Coniosporium uncinatum TaxID=93489 RepID=A0ACC3D2Q3_9PEZI|nr:hypothetical protein LTS18_007246 [Coniosporium uncinatum]
MLFALGGWLLMCWMVYLMIVTARTIPKIWDPYEVLGVSRSADEKAIKSHYRRLSLTQHPDKVRLDPAKNQTIESVNDHWVEITKAFKTLTDEDIRQNYLLYGHPDGKQSYSIGIALPKFIIQEGNGKYVLMLYGIFLGVILPYYVGKWWYGTQRVTKERVLVASAGNLFREYEDGINEGGVVSALSAGEEYNDVLKGSKADSGLARVEQMILADGEKTPFAGGLNVKDVTKLRELDEGVRRKALALLWAYLSRMELKDDELNDQKFDVVPTALALNEAFTTICLAYGNVGPLLASYHTSQNLIQAIAPGQSPLLQLPFFTPAVVAAVEGESARTHMTIQEFMRLPAHERKNRTIGPDLLDSNQYQQAVNLASHLPHLQVEEAFFKVKGERHIVPNSLVQFVVKARIIPPGTVDVPKLDPKDLVDRDEDEDEEDTKAADKKDTSIQPPIAYAPRFARDHSPRWHVFLADSKQGKIAVPPFTFSTFDKPLFKDDGSPTFAVQTFRMQFGAPPQMGRYTFAMHLVCDSYVGFDFKGDVIMDVADPAKAEEMESEEDISEPEEDSIAGQMAALKGGAAPPEKPKKARKPKVQEVQDSDDESDTEGEMDTESETDTDTDSDGE